MLDCPAGPDPRISVRRRHRASDQWRKCVRPRFVGACGRVRTRGKGNRAGFVQASADHRDSHRFRTTDACLRVLPERVAVDRSGARRYRRRGCQAGRSTPAASRSQRGASRADQHSGNADSLGEIGRGLAVRQHERGPEQRALLRRAVGGTDQPADEDSRPAHTGPDVVVFLQG